MEIPAWVDLVKTATFKELAPTNPDWYYIRAASIARRIYLRPHTGVGGLSKAFGGRERRGARTEHFKKANTGLIRHILQQLENIGVVEIDGKGRVITKQGQQDLDRIAGNVRKEREAQEEEDEDDSVSEDDSEEDSDEDSDSD